MTADTRFEDFEAHLDVDLNGVFLCTKHELRAMAEPGRGLDPQHGLGRRADRLAGRRPATSPPSTASSA